MCASRISSIRLLRYLRLRPFDTSTEDGRAKERYRRAILTSLTSILTRGASAAVALAVVPISLHYLGPERYGVWMAITSFTALMSFADLGLGFGLVNAVATATGKEDRVEARRAVSSAVFMLSAIALAVGTVGAVLFPYLPWARVLNTGNGVASLEAAPSMLALGILFLIGLPIGVAARVQTGSQEGFIAGIWSVVGTVVSLLLVILTVSLRASMPWLVVAALGGPLLANVANGVHLFRWHCPDLSPSWACVNGKSSVKLLRTGFLFLILQICSAAAFSVDSIVIAQLFGPSTVAEYSVAQKLFALPASLAGIAFAPLWPAYGEAIARGDIRWVRANVVRSMKVAIGLGVGMSTILGLLAAPIARVWVGTDAVPRVQLIVAFGAWTALITAATPLAMFLNGANVIREQVAIAIALAIVSLFAKIFFGKAFGVVGVVWGTFFSYILVAAVPYCLLIPRLLRTVGSRRSA